MVKLLIVGPNGNMGRALVRTAARTPSVDLVGGVGPKGRDYIGIDLGLLVGLGRHLGARVSDDIEHVIDGSDVVLECTRPAVSIGVLEACLAHGRAFATGTTGFSEEQATRIRQAGDAIPVLHASNGSPTVHLLYELVRLVSQEVGQDADIDIVEMHGRTKLDAPSGTAKEIGEIIADTLGLNLDRVAEYGREGMGRRESGSVQYNSIRSGGTPSTHRVIFGFQNERLELAHQVYNTDAFADGLIEGAQFISGRDSGFYTLQDVFEDK
jgi:4-hydroxy-tetrahydrodipicolinate reductase